MAVVSYIQLIKFVDDFASQHEQIQRFKAEFSEQLPNFATENEAYPILFMAPIDSRFLTNEDNFNVRFYCFDIIQKDRANINNILSDTNLILNDLKKWFKDGDNYTFDILNDPTAIPINNALLDYAAGWQMDVTFNVDTYCYSEIPFADSPLIPVEGYDVVYSRFLTCETVTGCTSFQQYIENALNNFTGSTGTEIFVTGGTYNQSTGVATFTNTTGGTFNVSGFSTNYRDTFVSGGTYNTGTGVATFTNTTGGTFTVSGFTTGGGDSLWEVGSTGNFSLKTINDSGLDATGDYSLAEGFQTFALGEASHAEGYQTTAEGNYSHAEGRETTAIDQYSHAEGRTTTAFGPNSHSEGNITIAIGASSHAEGISTTAEGNYSHAEGAATSAIGEASHSEGSLTTASGPYSHAEGLNTIASGQTSHAQGNATIAFGEYSHAEGNSTTATGESSHSEGEGTSSIGFYSHSEGQGTIAFGESSHAEGKATVAEGNFSHAEGETTTSLGRDSHAEGFGTVAQGDASHAEGQTTLAESNYSHAEGQNSTAFGNASHAEGGGTRTLSEYAHAEGYQTLAAGNSSHAEGFQSSTFGNYSHAEGVNTTTTAEGVGSHAGGYFSVASGLYSFVHGSASTASAINTVVFGANITGTSNNTVYVPNIQFDLANSNSPLEVGRMKWNDSDGTVDLRLKGNNVTLQIGQEHVVRVVNKTGANLLESQYRAVRVRNVSEGGAQGQRLAVVLAQANSDINALDTIGIVTENINDNQEGFITLLGQVRSINTTGSLQGETWVDGDVLYLSPTSAGGLTKIKPIAPNKQIVIGYVEYAHANNGKIYVNIQNGYDIEDLNNVRLSGSPTNGQSLVYSSSLSAWTNSTIALTGSSGTDVFVTGGTYSNTTGTATFRNTTGGTFNVTGFSTGATQAFRLQSSSATVAGSSGNRFVPVGVFINSGTEPVTQLYVEYPMTLKQLIVKSTNTQPATGTFTFVVRRNGVDTALSVTIAAGAVANTFIATTDVALVAGDLLNYRLNNAATTTSANITQISLVYV